MSDNSGEQGSSRDDHGDVRDLAALIALDAVDEVERARILRAVAHTGDAERSAFDAELRAAREALARVSDATAMSPPAALRAQILDRLDDREIAEADTALPSAPEQPSRRMRLVAAAAAAAVVLGIGGAVIGYTIADRGETVSPSQAEQIFAAPDVRTTTGTVAGGKASVTYSPSTGEGVLVMNDVPSPAPGTIYQMWLLGPGEPRLAGTMTEADIAPSTTALITDMSGATAVAFTVGDAATPDKMIADPVAELPLS